MFGFVLRVAYDGTPFSGFARQANARTVAGELDGAVLAMDPRATPIRGASRTDAGVHARGQLAAFDCERDIDARGWVLGLAQHLPDEISIMRAARVEPGWDPRDHALSKTYRYLVLRSAVRDPLLSRRTWRMADRLNHDMMRAEAHALTGEHDFSAFRAATDQREDCVRRIDRADVFELPGDARCLVVEVVGNRFLYKMMRVIAGTLVDVGRGRLPEGAVVRALASGTRSLLGMTAPPEGLYLEHIEVDDEGSDAWPV